MPYKADIYKVMIASPSDVQREREAIREIIHEWNVINSESQNLVLMPVAWESHSFPTMGDRPQEIINRQLLSNCDLLVATFWTRLGSPTGKSASGTVEEIEKHLAEGKPAMIYFSDTPVRPDSIDESQYQALKEFKNKCRQQGLVEDYESIEEFKDKFRRQLAQTIKEHFAVVQENEAIVGAVINDSGDRLSESARELLLEASKDKSGILLRAPYKGGINIQTNEREFVIDKDPRTEAKWESAITELEENGLIEAKGYKRELFSVTHKGYEMADKINKDSIPQRES
jgi:hypothetical protein